MRELTINTQSWHYKALAWLNKYDAPPEDICGYTRAMMFLFIGAVATAIVAFVIVIAPLADFLAWVVAMVVAGEFIRPTGLAVIATILLSVAALVGSIYLLSNGGVIARIRNSEVGQIASAIGDGIHNKMCFRVNYK